MKKCKTNTPSNQGYRTPKTRYFQLRLTEDEYAELKRKSADFYSVSQFIRYAVTEFTDISLKQRIELMVNLSKYYQKFHNQLSWAGGNLNQSVKRANELSVAGLLSARYIKDELMPTILETQKTINELKRELETLTRNANKL